MSQIIEDIREQLYARGELPPNDLRDLDPELLQAQLHGLDAAELAISKLPGGSPVTPKDERSTRCSGCPNAA